MDVNEVICADCLNAMRDMPEGSVDAIVTDPPYGLGFMGKEWDHNVPGVPYWAEALRVAKPGAHLLCFGGTRTFHRMACAIEDAGWEVRDCVMWVYGSGFPKSMDVAKAVERGHGADAAAQWDGWGTCLKPAWEPIIVARKPLDGTVARNVMAHGTGALNIDACRVPTFSDGPGSTPESSVGGRRGSMAGAMGRVAYDGSKGRFPANLVHDGSQQVLDLFPDSKGQLASLSGREPSRPAKNVYGEYGRHSFERRGDSGSAARFFYCAKASKRERGEGNNHPTIKPLALMEWLIKLVTPEDGVVLDPFCGSGSTLVAAKRLGRRFIGIDMERRYCDIALRRLEGVVA